MKQKKSENQDAMSTGELLGKLKQNYSEDGAVTREKGKAPRNQTPVSDDDDLDIAALLKQYLPDADKPAPAADDAEFDLLPDEAAPAELSADETNLEDELDDAGEALASDEEVLAEEMEMPAVARPGAKSGAHFASLLDALADEPAPAADPVDAMPEIAGVDDFPADPMNDFGVDKTPKVKKYVYHFRPSARNGQTVKVQETVTPVEQPVPQNDSADSYFAGRSKPEFALDDEPVIPDASAFADLVPPVQPEAPETAASDEPALETVETVDSEAPDAEETSAEAEEEQHLDDTDINLMIALGYEDELSKTVGIDRVSEIEKQLDSEVGDEDTRESAAFRGFEYTEKNQAKEIMQNYKAEHSGVMLRLFGTMVLLVALFLYENVSLFGIELPGALNMQQYPAVHTLISLQMLVLCGALSWRQLLDGLKGAVTLKPTPQSLAAVAVAVAAVYDVVIAIAAPQGGVLLYNFPAALCLALLVLGDLMNLKREMYSFTILADRREKFAVRAKLTPGMLPEDEADLTLDIRRAKFIDNYFTRTNRKPAANSRLNFVLLPVVALAIALAIVSFSVNKDGIAALNIFALTVMFCLPASTLIACSYPLFRAAQIAYEQDTAIVGETSAEEYSGASTVSFADKDVFPSYSVKLRSIKLYGNARPDLVLFAAASVFSKVGGPLDDVLELATKELDHAETVELVRIAENGIEAVVDGGNVIIGRAEFLEAYNIYPLHDAEDDANTAGGARILYIVMDGVLSAKLYIQYDMDVDFEFTLRELGREGIAARIRTYDPNIDDELLTAKLRGKPYNVHVDKQLAAPDEADPLDHLDSGLVSRSSAKSLIHTATMCSRLTHVEHTNGIIRGVALAVSLLIMLFLTILSSSVGISSVYVALYQLFWLVPALIITRLFVK